MKLDSLLRSTAVCAALAVSAAFLDISEATTPLIAWFALALATSFAVRVRWSDMVLLAPLAAVEAFWLRCYWGPEWWIHDGPMRELDDGLVVTWVAMLASSVLVCSAGARPQST